MKNYNRLSPLLLAALLISVSGCKLTQPVEQHTRIKTPETFAGNADSAGIGSIQWKTFFTDHHLVALIDTALQNNLDLKMAVQRLEMARAGITAAHGALLPTISGDVSGGGRKFGDYTMDGVGNYDTNFSGNIDNDRPAPSSSACLIISWAFAAPGK